MIRYAIDFATNKHGESYINYAACAASRRAA